MESETRGDDPKVKREPSANGIMDSESGANWEPTQSAVSDVYRHATLTIIPPPFIGK